MALERTSISLRIGAMAGFVMTSLVINPAYGAPFCGPFTDQSPQEAVGSVAAGAIGPGSVIHPRLDPNKDCNADSGAASACGIAVRPGTQGVELTRADGWVCIGVPGRRPLDVWYGWVPVSRWLRAPDAPTPATSSWAGVWQNEGARLNITTHEARVHIDGHAIWQGSFYPRFGDLTIDGAPQGSLLMNVLGADRCVVVFRRIGAYIFANDNGECGALNVTFTGLYRFRPGLKVVARQQ